MELIGILGLLFAAAVVFVVLAVVVLPFVILFQLIGLGVRFAFGALGLVIAGVVVLPIIALLGGLLLFKLVLLGLPLLLLIGLIWLLTRLARPEPRPA